MMEMTVDYKEILDAYGFDQKDRFISRMYIHQTQDSKKSSTYHYKLQDLIHELNTCKKDDLYISMNDFNSPVRKEENVHRLKHLYVDLDTYHSEYASLPYCNDHILQILEENYFGKKFPEPNLTISSGRGLYLIWNINEHKNALPRWKTVQKYLCSLLKEFGADPKVSTDSARVLRVPGSTNTKSGEKVSILRKTTEEHTLYEFLDLYMPDSYMKGIRTHEIIRKQKSLQASIQNENELDKTLHNPQNIQVNAKMECKIAAFHSQKTLVEARLSDLETLLFTFRDKEHGSKEYIFFLYRMWALSLYKDSNLVKEKILALNAKLYHSADPDRLLAETNSAERYFNDFKVRNMKNETIITFLSITEKEMLSLKTIISKEEAKRRKSLRNKAFYDAKLESNNETRKQDKIQLRYTKILSLKEQGYSTKEISEILGQSYRQTLRDIKNMTSIQPEHTIDQTSQNPVDSLQILDISSKGEYIYSMTKIKPYSLQDEVLSTLGVTMKTQLSFMIDAIHDGSTIFDYLKSKGFSGQNIIYLKQHSDTVCINGTAALLKTILHTGDHLTIDVIEEPKETTIEAVCLPLNILFEDEHILVVDKPYGMSIHPSINHYKDTLANAVKYYFDSKNQSVTYRCINRLDRDTSGLTILAKHMFSASILYSQMAERAIHREYLAIVEGVFDEEEGIVDAPIARKGDSIIEREVNFEAGEHAVTNYKVLAQKNGMSLLSLWLETGRTHQIRVHMKYIGHPLIGDFLYNPSNKSLDRQALHSYHLSFVHPVTGQEMNLEAEIPADMRSLFMDET